MWSAVLFPEPERPLITTSRVCREGCGMSGAGERPLSRRTKVRCAPGGCGHPEPGHGYVNRHLVPTQSLLALDQLPVELVRERIDRRVKIIVLAFRE